MKKMLLVVLLLSGLEYCSADELKTARFQNPKQPIIHYTTSTYLEAAISRGEEIDAEWNAKLIAAEARLIKTQKQVKIAFITESENLDSQDLTLRMKENSYIQDTLDIFKYYGNLIILDRTNLDKILKELKLSYTGILENGSIEAGKLLGVTHLIMLNVTFSKGIVFTTGKLVDVETGKILCAWQEAFNLNKPQSAKNKIPDRLPNKR